MSENQKFTFTVDRVEGDTILAYRCSVCHRDGVTIYIPGENAEQAAQRIKGTHVCIEPM